MRVENTRLETAVDRGTRRLGPLLFSLGMLFVAGFCAIALRLPLEYLVGVVPDDAFYYLQVARHTAADGIPSFDGIHPTNGYHPAWMFILSIVSRVVSDRVVVLKTCLVLCFVLHALAGALLVLIFRRLFGAHAGWIAGALWLVNRLPLSIALMGVEASLAVVAHSLVILAAVRCLFSTPAPLSSQSLSMRDMAMLGLALAAAFWARTDSLVLACVSLAVLPTWLITSGHGIRAGCRAALYAVTSFILGVLPWFAYSWHTTGSLAQSSGAMKLIWAARRHPSLLDRLNDTAGFLAWQWAGLPLDAMLGIPYALTPLAGAAVVALVAVAVWQAGPARRNLAAISIWLAAAWALTGAVYAALYTDYQLWYLGFPGFIIFFLVLAWLAGAGRRLRLAAGVRDLIAAGAFLVFLSTSLSFVASIPLYYPWQVDVHASQPHFEAMIPAGARIGCFNAGLPAFFSDRTIINLDGLVNNSILPYYRERRFDAYLRDADIAYIIDGTYPLERALQFAQHPPGLIPLASAPLRAHGGGRRWLWQVEAGR